MSKVDVLSQYPEFGRMVPEENDKNIREIVFRPYRIIYQVFEEKEVIGIARIWHGARGEPEIPSELNL